MSQTTLPVLIYTTGGVYGKYRAHIRTAWPNWKSFFIL